jgi:hypothetical protein
MKMIWRLFTFAAFGAASLFLSASDAVAEPHPEQTVRALAQLDGWLDSLDTNLKMIRDENHRNQFNNLLLALHRDIFELQNGVETTVILLKIRPINHEYLRKDLQDWDDGIANLRNRLRDVQQRLKFLRILEENKEMDAPADSVASLLDEALAPDQKTGSRHYTEVMTEADLARQVQAMKDAAALLQKSQEKLDRLSGRKKK